jgi:predicted nuclease of predicted toxin-antitoxin system
VRVLLDEQLPRQLAPELTDHDVRTVQQQRWAGLRNGELLRRAAEAGFEVFVTADQNIAFQQNLTGSPLRVIVLAAASNARG